MVLSVMPAGSVSAQEECAKPVYLTFDTGHMGVARLVGDILERQGVLATFFIANEPTRTGGTSLDDEWAPWWREMAERGHRFASHTYDHVYWLADLPDGRFRVRASAGPQAGRIQEWTAAQYCDELARVDDRFEQMTSHHLMPLFRAPGGKTSPALLRAAQECGYMHVHWSPAGFLGDELPSDKYPNAVLLERALHSIQPGDILMAHLGIIEQRTNEILAHLGIWSRQDPWAPAVLEPLIEGLKERGFCFATLESHPGYRNFLLTEQAGTEPTWTN